MSINVIGCELTKIKATYPATTISNIVFSTLKWSILKINAIWYNHVNPLELCPKLHSKCSVIISKIIFSKQSKQWSHQAQLLITSQLSSYKINLYTHGRISDSPTRQSTKPHIVSHPKIISLPSSYKIKPGLKLLTLYLVGWKREYANLEQLGMERS